MKSRTKSSITLPPEELKLVISLQAQLKAKSKVDVVRRGLRLLQETTDRQRMREAYRRASLATRGSLAKELEELDPLVGEGLEEPPPYTKQSHAGRHSPEYVSADPRRSSSRPADPRHERDGLASGAFRSRE